MGLREGFIRGDNGYLPRQVEVCKEWSMCKNVKGDARGLTREKRRGDRRCKNVLSLAVVIVRKYILGFSCG